MPSFCTVADRGPAAASCRWWAESIRRVRQHEGRHHEQQPKVFKAVAPRTVQAPPNFENCAEAAAQMRIENQADADQPMDEDIVTYASEAAIPEVQQGGS